MMDSFQFNIRVGKVFKDLKRAYDGECRYLICQGGSGSGKTYGICQLLITEALANPGIKISIVRKSMPILRQTAMDDFFKILKALEANGQSYYNQKFHNKTGNYYEFSNGSVIEFFSVDEEQKIRGRKRDVLYMNEANELEHKEYIQLAMRTSGKIILDFNPSDADHWIYDLANNDKAILLKSTYKDNPFLPAGRVREIEELILTDENNYRIYALGERPLRTTRIYNHFKTYNNRLWHEHPEVVSTHYGLDFGFNHSTALVRVRTLADKRVLVDQVIYKTGLTTADLILEMKAVPNLEEHIIWCDHAAPANILEIQRAGFKARKANKEVKEGINSVKNAQVYINESSTDLLNESRRYSWRMKGERILDEPVKLHDDGLDAVRYAIHSPKGKTFNGASIRF